MYSPETFLLFIIAAVLVGAAIGFLLSRRFSPDAQKQRELERSLDRVLEQQKDYQHEVVEHFTDTAKLLNTLSESYRDVHNHLASGAAKLTDTSGATLLEPLPENTLEDLSQETEASEVQQPLDYAPKESPHQTGMLNEEFGLNKEAAPATEAPAAEPVAEKA